MSIITVQNTEILNSEKYILKQFSKNLDTSTHRIESNKLNPHFNMNLVYEENSLSARTTLSESLDLLTGQVN